MNGLSGHQRLGMLCKVQRVLEMDGLVAAAYGVCSVDDDLQHPQDSEWARETPKSEPSCRSPCASSAF